MKKYVITVNGTKYEVIVEEADMNAKFTKAEAPKAAPAAPAAAPAAAPKAAPSAGANSVKAPLPGNILKVKVSQGASVKKGDLLCVLEAMKMENEILAPSDGTVSAVYAKEGSSVQSGDVLFELA